MLVSFLRKVRADGWKWLQKASRAFNRSGCEGRKDFSQGLADDILKRGIFSVALLGSLLESTKG